MCHSPATVGIHVMRNCLLLWDFPFGKIGLARTTPPLSMWGVRRTNSPRAVCKTALLQLMRQWLIRRRRAASDTVERSMDYPIL